VAKFPGAYLAEWQVEGQWHHTVSGRARSANRAQCEYHGRRRGDRDVYDGGGLPPLLYDPRGHESDYCGAV